MGNASGRNTVSIGNRGPNPGVALVIMYDCSRKSFNTEFGTLICKIPTFVDGIPRDMGQWDAAISAFASDAACVKKLPLGYMCVLVETQINAVCECRRGYRGEQPNAGVDELRWGREHELLTATVEEPPRVVRFFA